MKLSDLKSRHEALADDLADPAFRAEWERTALAREVAVKVTKYRAENGLSQRALAQQLGMKQPAIARLEAGDVTPSIDTLIRLARGLGIAFHVDITSEGLRLTA
jgi:ribosome-binding protein aMBF1 (putative translation factor)